MKELQAEEFESGAGNRSPNEAWRQPGIACKGVSSIELPRTEKDGFRHDPNSSSWQHDNRDFSKLK